MGVALAILLILDGTSPNPAGYPQESSDMAGPRQAKEVMLPSSGFVLMDDKATSCSLAGLFDGKSHLESFCEGKSHLE